MYGEYAHALPGLQIGGCSCSWLARRLHCSPSQSQHAHTLIVPVPTRLEQRSPTVLRAATHISSLCHVPYVEKQESGRREAEGGIKHV
jgi:hypothetical protein